MPKLHRIPRSLLVAAAYLAMSLASCTYYSATDRFAYSRMGDTLFVRLSPTGQARWDPTKDSLLITCSNCDPASSRLVERFEDNLTAVYEIDPEANLNLRMNYMGRVESVDLPGTADTLSATPKPHAARRMQARQRKSSVATKEESTPKKPVDRTPDKPVDKTVAATPEKPRTARSVKVTALEGVAIYKDKSKTEVLKIVPVGTNIALLAREGDLYSVSIDGQEGFVEAEAVQVNE